MEKINTHLLYIAVDEEKLERIAIIFWLRRKIIRIADNSKE